MEDLCPEVKITSVIAHYTGTNWRILLINNGILQFNYTGQKSLNSELSEQIQKYIDYNLPDRWTDFNTLFVWDIDKGIEIIFKPIWTKDESVPISEDAKWVNIDEALQKLSMTVPGQRLGMIIGAC